MDQGPLVMEQIKAGESFLKDFAASVPVVTAYWLKNSEDGSWTLHIAIDRYEDNLRLAHRERSRITGEMNNPHLGLFRIGLVNLTDPLVRAVLDFYKEHAAKIPFRFRGTFGDRFVEEIYLIQGPTGEYTMPSGRETLNRIIDEEASFFQQHGVPPRRMKLPVMMAYDLAKCGREEIGELSGRVFKDGVDVFEKEGFHGMRVEIVRDVKATLQLE